MLAKCGCTYSVSKPHKNVKQLCTRNMLKIWKIKIINYNRFKRIRYCPGNSLELFSASLVMAVCHAVSFSYSVATFVNYYDSIVKVS